MSVKGVRWRPTQCRDCKRRERKNLKISARGLCTRCAANRLGAVHEQIRQQQGPYYEKWRRRMLQACDVWEQPPQAS